MIGQVGTANSSVSSLDVVTLVIAVIGALTGVSALAWGVAQHILSGARVKVDLVGGWFMGAGIVSGPIGTIHRPEGVGDPVVGVQVRNVGRLPATVTVWGVRAGETSFHSFDFESFNPKTPHRIDVGEEVTWYVPAQSVVAQAHAAKEVLGDDRLSARVVLGTGKEIRARKKLDASTLGRLAP